MDSNYDRYESDFVHHLLYAAEKGMENVCSLFRVKIKSFKQRSHWNTRFPLAAFRLPRNGTMHCVHNAATAVLQRGKTPGLKSLWGHLF